MAREIVVHTWCDPCLEEDKHTPGEELPPLLLPELGGHRPRVAAVCEVHRKELYQPLVDLLEEHGQVIDDEGNPSGPRGKYGQAKGEQAVTCPDCGHTSPNRSALSSHARGQHAKSLSQLLGEPTPFSCPECDYASNRPQGLAAHRRAVHGLTAADQQAQRAAEEADPELDLEEPEKPAKKAAARRPRKKA